MYWKYLSRYYRNLEHARDWGIDLIERIVTGSEGGGYSLAVLATGTLVFVSGHGPYRNGAVVKDTLESDVLLTLGNIGRTIERLGGTKSDIVKCNCYLSDIELFDRFDAAYRSFFEGSLLPARTTIGAHLYEGMAVEIEAICVLPEAA